MLSPFLIRDLHTSQLSRERLPNNDITSSTESLTTGKSTTEPHGIVQLTSSEYDNIASNYPRARLTYIDDDDGDLITVGSSLELSQRLSEPANSSNQVELTLQHFDSLRVSSPANAGKIHLFDIRRSNSVTELWKRYEHPSCVTTVQNTETQGDKTGHSSFNYEAEKPPSTSAAPAESDGSRSLLGAFEAEMRKLLNVPGSESVQQSQSGYSSPAAAGPGSSNSGRHPSPAETLIQAIHDIVNGAEMVRGGVMSKIPEFERRLHDAQRDFPEHVGTALQAALTILESNVRNLTSVINSISISGPRRSNSDTQPQSPTAPYKADGLFTVASEIGQVGQTLFTAFERELKNCQRDTVHTRSVRSTSAISGKGEQKEVDTADPEISARTPGPGYDNGQTTSSRNSRNAIHSGQFGSITREDSDALSDSTYSEQHYIAPLHSSMQAEVSGAENVSPSMYNLESVNTSPAGPCKTPLIHTRSLSQVPLTCPRPSTPRRRHAGPYKFADRAACPAQQLMSRSQQKSAEPNMQRQASSNTLFIGNVGFSVSTSMIQAVFASKGFLVDVDLPVDPQTQKHAGFGYLKFASAHAAKAALDALQGTYIDGHSINLEFSEDIPAISIQAQREPQEVVSQVERNKSEDYQRVKSRGSLNTHDNRESVLRQEIPHLMEQNDKCEERAPDDKGKQVLSTEISPSSACDASEAVIRALARARNLHKIIPNAGLRPDLHNGDPEFSARYPSLLPEVSAKRSRFCNVPDTLTHLNPELEMRRFPSVSQLNAQTTARQDENMRPTVITSASEAIHVNDEDAKVRAAASLRIPGSLTQDFQARGNGEQPRQSLKRSNSATPVNMSAKLTEPFNTGFSVGSGSAVRPLRRRATERHSLHHRTGEGRHSGPYWGRPVVKVPELMHPLHSCQGSPANLTSTVHEQAVQASTPSNVHRPEDQARTGSQRVDSCVATLLKLGYGEPDDSDHTRIRMYSEVTNGKVLEAIEMIEEERKAYEQQMHQ